LGTAFARLEVAPAVEPHLERLVRSSTWTDRQDAYTDAAVALAVRCNEVALIDPIDPTPRPYHGRPFRVLHAERFAEACLAGTPLRTRGWRGAVDQWVDNVDVLGGRTWLAAGDDRDADLGLDPRLLQPVVISSPLDRWPADFDRWADRIRAALGPIAIDVEHIGATSVPGLPAKDVIDVQVLVADLEPAAPIVDAFASIGMAWSTEPWNRREPVPDQWDGPPDAWDQLVFRSVEAGPDADDGPPANVHVRVEGSAGARRSRLFRDYLRADPATRDAWGRFKIETARRVRHLAAYGQVKAPATELVQADAERWAAESAW
jgi:dephospho-CoA kinase